MKKSEPTLRHELGDVSYLEAHPKVCKLFHEVGCFKYYEKIQGFHQQVDEYFSLSFDGSKEAIGREESLIDEALISEVTELPCTGEKWFKTTIPKDVEFRSYLKPDNRGMIWKKSVPSSWLEES